MSATGTATGAPVAARDRTASGAGRPGPVRRRRTAVWVGAFLLPAVALVAVFLVLPFLQTVYRSFFRDNGFTSSWVGLGNYRGLFTDPAFGQSVLNTVMWVVGTLLLPVGIGLAIATATHRLRWGGLARFALVLPYALSGSATALLWTFVLRSDGALDSIVTTFAPGSTPPEWLLVWPLNTVVMILASTWQGTGAAVILFLVGLQAIPAEMIEAATLDGARGWRLFRSVTLPQLRPVTVVVVGISIVNGLKTFDIIWLLTRGGPGTESETLALTMYRETFTLSRYGAGAAVAVVLTVVVVAASWIYLRRQVRPA